MSLSLQQRLARLSEPECILQTWMRESPILMSVVKAYVDCFDLDDRSITFTSELILTKKDFDRLGSQIINENARLIRDVSTAANARVELMFMLKGAKLAYTWSKTKGIYRFDPDFAKSLQREGVQEDLPCDLLKELPERCIWLDCPQGGIFVCHVKRQHGDEVLEFNTTDRNDLTSFILPLEAGNVFDILRSSVERQKKHGEARGITVPMAGTEQIYNLLAQYVPLLIYLCSANCEYRDLRPAPRGEAQVRRKGFWRPLEERLYHIGEQQGAEIRRFKQAVEVYDSLPAESKGQRVRPHWRKAHYHQARTGSMALPKEQRPLRWHYRPGVHVNKYLGDIQATVHKVKPPPANRESA